MNKNFFENYVIVKNKFFNNPIKILNLFDKEKFYSANEWPGKRTNNLLESKNEDIRQFALFFAEKLSREIFIGIHHFMIDVRFHINEVCIDDKANRGWIHSDPTDLAGLVYLTPEEIDFDSGTSIFIKNDKQEFSTDDFISRQEFNLTGNASSQYLTDLDNNHSSFSESIRVGNLFNRLIAYDSRLFHRPNSYNLLSGNQRKTLLFFIKGYQIEHLQTMSTNSTWIDL